MGLFSADEQNPGAGVGGEGASHIGHTLRPRSSAAQDLIEERLGAGQVNGSEVVWRISRYGRACIVYLHRWEGGRETITSMDTARPSVGLALHIDPTAPLGMEMLEAELRSLTTMHPSKGA